MRLPMLFQPLLRRGRTRPTLLGLAWFGLPTAIVVGGVLVPMVYLVVRASEAEASEVSALVLRLSHLKLLWNTIALAAGVLVVSSAIAMPMAWLSARTDMPARGLLTLLGVIPLAIPGYVMAYALLASTGTFGMLNRTVGLNLPRPTGYFGALIALSLYAFPYLFLNLRSALRRLDASLEESARALGHTQWQVFLRVTLPQLRPAFQAGALLIGLHVLGDFGVVSLMRYETFSYALYKLYYISGDRIYAAWLALIMLALTAGLLVVEARLLRNLLLHRIGAGVVRTAGIVKLGWWKLPAALFVITLALAAVVLPLTAIFYWTPDTQAIRWRELTEALMNSLKAAGPAAVLAIALALPVVYLSVRRPSWWSRSVERIAYFGYATPPLAFAMAVIFFTLRAAPVLYGSLAVLIFAYAVHFIAEAVGPIRSALYQVPPRLEESARSLSWGPVATFWKVTFPLIRNGMLIGLMLVFLAGMKELPLMVLLQPLDFHTLAFNLWDKTNEADFAGAAPHALTITLVSSLFVAVLMWNDRRRG